jgi:hypothetical protein
VARLYRRHHEHPRATHVPPVNELACSRRSIGSTTDKALEQWAAIASTHSGCCSVKFLCHISNAVRNFWAAKNSQAGAEGGLLEAAKPLSTLTELNDNRRALRASVRSAKEDLRSLVEALKRCKGAMNEVFSQLGALDDALETRPEEGLRQHLQDHHEKLRQVAEAETAKGDAWIEQCQPFVGKSDWSFNDFNTVIACAQEIHEIISARGPSPTPASDNKRSSSKRKHTEEVEGPAPKAPRSATSAEHTDFDDYKEWLRQAPPDDANPSVDQTIILGCKEWRSYCIHGAA